MIDIFDFENADIAKLAIHLGRMHRGRKPRSLFIDGNGQTDQVLVSGPGAMTGYCVLNQGAGTAILHLTDGSFADNNHILGQPVLAASFAQLYLPAPWAPFNVSLNLTQLAGADAIVGRVFYLLDTDD